MTSWNYRIMRHKICGSTWYALHEVYYEGGKPTTWTIDPVNLHGDTADGIIKCLEQMLRDANKYRGKILKYK